MADPYKVFGQGWGELFDAVWWHCDVEVPTHDAPDGSIYQQKGWDGTSNSAIHGDMWLRVRGEWVRLGGAADVLVVSFVVDVRTVGDVGHHPAILCKAHAVEGDGGARMFFYDPTDTTSADNGGTILITNTSGRRYKTNTSVGVPITWFGAIADVTDFTCATTNAVATVTLPAAPVDGQRVVIRGAGADPSPAELALTGVETWWDGTPGGGTGPHDRFHCAQTLVAAHLGRKVRLLATGPFGTCASVSTIVDIGGVGGSLLPAGTIRTDRSFSVHAVATTGVIAPGLAPLPLTNVATQVNASIPLVLDTPFHDGLVPTLFTCTQTLTVEHLHRYIEVPGAGDAGGLFRGFVSDVGGITGSFLPAGVYRASASFGTAITGGTGILGGNNLITTVASHAGAVATLATAPAATFAHADAWYGTEAINNTAFQLALAAAVHVIVPEPPSRKPFALGLFANNTEASAIEFLRGGQLRTTSEFSSNANKVHVFGHSSNATGGGIAQQRPEIQYTGPGNGVCVHPAAGTPPGGAPQTSYGDLWENILVQNLWLTPNCIGWKFGQFVPDVGGYGTGFASFAHLSALDFHAGYGTAFFNANSGQQVNYFNLRGYVSDSSQNGSGGNIGRTKWGFGHFLHVGENNQHGGVTANWFYGGTFQGFQVPFRLGKTATTSFADFTGEDMTILDACMIEFADASGCEFTGAHFEDTGLVPLTVSPGTYARGNRGAKYGTDNTADNGAGTAIGCNVHHNKEFGGILVVAELINHVSCAFEDNEQIFITNESASFPAIALLNTGGPGTQRKDFRWRDNGTFTGVLSLLLSGGLVGISEFKDVCIGGFSPPRIVDVLAHPNWDYYGRFHADRHSGRRIDGTGNSEIDGPWHYDSAVITGDGLSWTVNMAVSNFATWNLTHQASFVIGALTPATSLAPVTEPYLTIGQKYWNGSASVDANILILPHATARTPNLHQQLDIFLAGGAGTASFYYRAEADTFSKISLALNSLGSDFSSHIYSVAFGGVPTSALLGSDAFNGSFCMRLDGATGSSGYLKEAAGDAGWHPILTSASGVIVGRTVTGTHPIYIDGNNAPHDLSADRTWALLGGATGQVITWVSGAAQWSTRTVTATAPLRIDGGSTADWTADRTFSINNVSSSGPGAAGIITAAGTIFSSPLGVVGSWNTPATLGIVTTSYTISTSGPITLDGASGGSGSLATAHTIGVLSATTSGLGVIQLADDLDGTATAPDVIAATGASGTFTVRCANLTFTGAGNIATGSGDLIVTCSTGNMLVSTTGILTVSSVSTLQLGSSADVTIASGGTSNLSLTGAADVVITAGGSDAVVMTVGAGSVALTTGSFTKLSLTNHELLGGGPGAPEEAMKIRVNGTDYWIGLSAI